MTRALKFSRHVPSAHIFRGSPPFFVLFVPSTLVSIKRSLFAQASLRTRLNERSSFHAVTRDLERPRENCALKPGVFREVKHYVKCKADLMRSSQRTKWTSGVTAVHTHTYTRSDYSLLRIRKILMYLRCYELGLHRRLQPSTC